MHLRTWVFSLLVTNQAVLHLWHPVRPDTDAPFDLSFFEQLVHRVLYLLDGEPSSARPLGHGLHDVVLLGWVCCGWVRLTQPLALSPYNMVPRKYERSLMVKLETRNQKG